MASVRCIALMQFALNDLHMWFVFSDLAIEMRIKLCSYCIVDQ